eukprot:scaffold208149_cov33-Tisochrysis_lutea.AAC.3
MISWPRQPGINDHRDQGMFRAAGCTLACPWLGEAASLCSNEKSCIRTLRPTECQYVKVPSSCETPAALDTLGSHRAHRAGAPTRVAAGPSERRAPLAMASPAPVAGRLPTAPSLPAPRECAGADKKIAPHF